MIASASQSRWKALRVLAPLLVLGQRSYEIYLTHIFAVMALFSVFMHLGKPLHAVPVLFVAAVIAAAALGWLVSSVCAEPVNLALGRWFGLDASSAGAAHSYVD